MEGSNLKIKTIDTYNQFQYVCLHNPATQQQAVLLQGVAIKNRLWMSSL